ncbi:MAG: M3 family metallopeptidase [Nitrosomonadales bacterium]|nr:M3 family metallopeptidase [Nitrosomonadales bacterium]
MNPLLDTSGLPRFAEIKPEHVTPAIEQLLADNRALIARLLADEVAPTWDNFMLPMEDANERLARTWGPVGHLNAVMNSPELREVYNANLPRITQYYAELGQNLALFNKVKALRASAEFDTLSVARKKIIENELRDFRLGGAELPDEVKVRFLAIQEEHSTLSSRYSDNLLDATNAYERVVEDEAELAGLPDDAKQAARDAADSALSLRGITSDLPAGGLSRMASSSIRDGVGERGDKPRWLFTLKAPSYLPLMQYADNRALREEMYRAYSTRAAEFGKPDWDNTPLMAQLLKLRAEEAALLGFNNAAELSLATKMANTPQQVLDFLRELARRARPFAEQDLAELREFARTELGLDDPQSWDIGYISEKLRERRYAFSEQEVKQYFPEDAVLAGMFRVTETLFGVKLRASTAPMWHEDARFFDILDAGGKLIGQFYLDLYARASKRGGAWMDDAVTRRRLASGAIQTPVAYLNCNFSAPVGGKPAVFTHDEVITLFHEFGHGLHHLLTEIEDLPVSGINGVEWDAVELPSQFMENFCWEWSVLQGMTRHVESGATLPRELFDKMLAAKNFQSGLATLRQIEFSLFDMRLHSDFDPNSGKTVLQLLDEVRLEVAVLIPPSFNRFPNSFSHIFAGGYSAGYYSYKWAEVLSADAYSLFEETGVLNADTGARFRREVLAAGGHRPAMDSFVAFRGREPAIDALLRHNGLAAD